MEIYLHSLVVFAVWCFIMVLCGALSWCGVVLYHGAVWCFTMTFTDGPNTAGTFVPYQGQRQSLKYTSF
jgi:hypothetical protein